jgi:tetratricopeptide (TPR) repeat protein
MKGYTTREVAEVLGLPISRILRWTRSGLIEPRRGARGAYVFSFQDIVLLRTARELLDANVPARRVRESLEALRDQLPVGRPLSAVTISAVGDRVVVQDADSVWEPDSGQMQIDFAVADVAKAASPVARRALARRGEDEEMTADDWYDSALDLEAVSTGEAIEAYRRALALDDGHSDSHLNLGRMLHEDGEVYEAESHYRRAIEADGESARAWFNLGVVLEDRDRSSEAIEAYLSAVRRDAGLAPAHFNLSRLLEASGHETEALGHLADYKRLIKRETGTE